MHGVPAAAHLQVGPQNEYGCRQHTSAGSSPWNSVSLAPSTEAGHKHALNMIHGQGSCTSDSSSRMAQQTQMSVNWQQRTLQARSREGCRGYLVCAGRALQASKQRNCMQDSAEAAGFVRVNRRVRGSFCCCPRAAPLARPPACSHQAIHCCCVKLPLFSVPSPSCYLPLFVLAAVGEA